MIKYKEEYQGYEEFRIIPVCKELTIRGKKRFVTYVSELSWNDLQSLRLNGSTYVDKARELFNLILQRK